MMGFLEASAALDAARDPQELFGERDSSPAGLRSARSRYRLLARSLHPDAVDALHKEAAARLFPRLVTLWESYTAPLATLTSPVRTYTLQGVSGRDDLTVHRPCTFVETGVTRRGLVRTLRDLRDADLLQREVRALTLLAQGEKTLLPYVPALVESFADQDALGEKTLSLVTRDVPDLVSLAHVRTLFPNGLDPRDVAWMWRRLLVAIGFAHQEGLVHGAPTPENVGIVPGEHGLVLQNWYYSCVPGEHIPAVVSARVDWTPQEVEKKLPASPATDIFLASRTVEFLLGDNMPRPMRLFLDGCLLPDAPSRPHHAWDLLQELDDLLENLWGPRKFRPFSLPTPGGRS